MDERGVSAARNTASEADVSGILVIRMASRGLQSDEMMRDVTLVPGAVADPPTSPSGDFEGFVESSGNKLRHAFAARYGAERGADAYAEALGYAWANWDRVQQLDDPIPYLFTVGRSRTRRRIPRRAALFLPTAVDPRQPDYEPALLTALATLTARQRTSVLLVVALGWTHAEVADLLGVQKATVQTHVDRALVALRAALNVKDGDDA